LQRGCVSHNHIFFRERAIDAALQARDWQEVHRHCAHLQNYTAEQSLPYSDFLIARGRTLVQWGERGPDPAGLPRLTALRAQAVECELNFALPSLDAALAQVASPSAARAG